MTEDDQAEISLSIPQGTLPSTNFCWYYLQKYIEYVQCASVALSTELICWTQAASGAARRANDGLCPSSIPI